MTSVAPRNANLRLYFCTLDSCVAYYLVAAECASDCFDIVERAHGIRAYGAYPGVFSVEFADARHLLDHQVRDQLGVPMFMSVLQYVSEPKVLWASEEPHP